MSFLQLGSLCRSQKSSGSECHTKLTLDSREELLIPVVSGELSRSSSIVIR
jgi:hypothetical protein